MSIPVLINPMNERKEEVGPIIRSMQSSYRMTKNQIKRYKRIALFINDKLNIDKESDNLSLNNKK